MSDLIIYPIVLIGMAFLVNFLLHKKKVGKRKLDAGDFTVGIILLISVTLVFFLHRAALPIIGALWVLGLLGFAVFEMFRIKK